MNYLRAAVDAMSARALAGGDRLPVLALEAFLADTTHQPRARRLAFELLAQSDPAFAQRRLPGLLNDPSSELRRDAVDQLLQNAAKERAASRNPAAVEIYQTALRSARDVDQIEAIAKALSELGQPADLPTVFGWLTEWKVVGPFDNTDRAGYARVFAPEPQVDLAAQYDGKAGKIRWQDHRATGDYGLLDLNQPCGALKEVTGYAFAEFRSATARPVELRLGCKNAWKVWLNGQLLFGREEYHRGAEIDQYRLQGQLKAGVNTILVKVCQNEQTEDWTKEWEFQLRVTDAQGTPIPQSQP